MNLLPMTDRNSGASKSLLDRLKAYLAPHTFIELEACATRLEKTLLCRGPLNTLTVLCMYGGGKDSSYMVVAARIMQLILLERNGETFRLRTATNRHPGMPAAVMDNIDRTFMALELYGCPDAELLLVHGNSIVPFSPKAEYPAELLARDRTDVLMNGHRCQGDPRPTFCNRCNITMENSLALAVGYNGQADVVLTGDSPSEQRYYVAWVRQAVRKLDGTSDPGKPGLHTFLRNLQQINQKLSSDVFGADSLETAERRIAVDSVCKEPQFFSIYQDTAYRVSDHWELITEFLGFVFDDIAFSFTESDCGNPGLMAHFNGLRHERCLGSTYEAGIREYADFAIGLMRRKDFPESLIQVVQSRYSSPSGIQSMRELMDAYARQAFCLTEENLVCMLFSPFTEGGKDLHTYLAAEKPNLLPLEPKIVALLNGNEDSNPEFLSGLLTRISGLKIAHLRRLFQTKMIPTREPNNSGKDPLSIILKGDPHKKLIERRGRDGVQIREMMSGR